MGVRFEDLVERDGRRLRGALVAAFGADLGADAAAEALAYGWENWERVGRMENPVGYLFRVGYNLAKRQRDRESRRPLFPAPAPADLPHVEPGLLAALTELTESQRIAVVLVHAYGWPLIEVAELLEVSHSTVRTHVARALEQLQAQLEVHQDVD
ncbi:MAG: sigma-70 family RNA polymerase sigma factor [Ilumatobacter sp.]|nr:sigma-70 family RNA polymerase sigma factor [Ilumatobacter sp.]